MAKYETINPGILSGVIISVKEAYYRIAEETGKNLVIDLGGQDLKAISDFVNKNT